MKRDSAWTALLGAGAAAGWVCLLALWLPRTFGATDDLAIDADVRGGFPTSFQSPLLGAGLSALHRSVAAEVPWYALYLYAALALALAVLLGVVLRLAAPLWARLGLVPAVLFALSGAVVGIGYNGVSILCGTAALLRFAQLQSGPTRAGALPLLGLGALLALSWLTRTSGIRASIAFGAVPFLLLVASSYRRGPLGARLREVVLLAAPLALVLVAAALHARAGTGDAGYREWNALRGAVHGFALGTEAQGNEELYAANGWTPNDGKLATGLRAFADEEKFNLETFGRVVELGRSSRRRPTPADALEDLRATLLAPFPHWLLFFVAATLIAGLAGGRRRALAVGVGAASALALAACLTLFLRFPERIALHCMTSAVLWTILLALSGDVASRGPGRRALLALLVAAALGAGLFELLGEVERSPRRRELAREHDTLFEELAALEPELVVVDSTLELWKGVDPLRGAGVRHLPHVPLGWPIYSPRFYAELERAGLERARDLFPALVDHDAYLVAPPPLRRAVVRYLEENHGIECDAKRVGARAPLAARPTASPALGEDSKQRERWRTQRTPSVLRLTRR